MEHFGPRLESLLRRLSECPSEFLETVQGPRGAIQTIAIVRDHFRFYGTKDPVSAESPWVQSILQADKPSIPRVRYWGTLAVACWLLHHDWFLHRQEHADGAWRWLQSDALRQLAELVNPSLCITDPDRREELVRLCLSGLGLRPEGESLEQALDRKVTLDSVERQRILFATAEAEKRARDVREAMAKKRALESASRYGE